MSSLNKLLEYFRFSFIGFLLLLLCFLLGIYISTLSIIYVSVIIWYQGTKLNNKTNPNLSRPRRHPSCSANHMLLGSMVDESSSTTVIVVSPRRPTVLNETDRSQNLIVLNVNSQASLKLIAANYSVWRLQFTSLLFKYDLLGFIDGSKLCPLVMITLSDNTFPSLNPDHILWLKQDQLLLNAIVGSVFTTLVQFISTSATSRAAHNTLKKTYASPSLGRIMTHRQNIASPQQGNQTTTNYMQDVKHNIGSLALMNVSVDFDELSIHVLNRLGQTYSHISHALQARDTPVTFEELFEHLLSYEA